LATGPHNTTFGIYRGGGNYLIGRKTWKNNFGKSSTLLFGGVTLLIGGWVGEKTKAYTVQSGYGVMKAIPDIPRNYCLSKVWSLKVPATTKVFGWRVLIDRLPFKINLEKRERLGFRVIHVLCATRMRNLLCILCYHVRLHKEYGSSVIGGQGCFLW